MADSQTLTLAYFQLLQLSLSFFYSYYHSSANIIAQIQKNGEAKKRNIIQCENTAGPSIKQLKTTPKKRR